MLRRRRAGRPPPIDASTEAEPPIELEVRVRPGTEEAALQELRALGAEGEAVDRGELRLTPLGPLGPILCAESALAFYAVRSLGELEPDADSAVRAALNLAGVVAALRRGKLRSYRVTGGQEGGLAPSAVNRLGQFLGARLGIEPVLIQPELILIARIGRGGGLEIAARLPRPGERRAPIRVDGPPARSSPRPRRARRR